MSSGIPSLPRRPLLGPVELVPVDRTRRSVLQNLGQLYRHDLSEAYGHLPNPDGTFNDRPLDQFLAGIDPHRRAWLITSAGRLGGFVLTEQADGGGTSISAFFVVRALRRTGLGRAAAGRLIALVPGRWSIGFQSYNPGAAAFWRRVATDVAGEDWATHDGPTIGGRPPDSFITFATQ